ncbi:MAG: N-acetylmuramoyl-L-alanine amidase [Bryobacterales bacterium]|nr:N-acetylmuramoyl-L-alanine amidase [Bryobacterales bacterium]
MRLATLIVTGILACGFIPGGVARSAPLNTLREIRTWSLGDSTRIAIEIDGTLTFRHDRLADPPRLFFDLDETSVGTLRGSAATITVGDPVVRQVRVGILRRGVARVVVDLFEQGEYTVSQLTNPSRLVVEVRRGSAAPRNPAVEPPAQPLTPPPAIEPPAPPVPISAVSSKAEPKAVRRTIVVKGKRRHFIEAPRATAARKPAPPLWTLAAQPRVTGRLVLSHIAPPPTWVPAIPARPPRKPAVIVARNTPATPAPAAIPEPPPAPRGAAAKATPAPRVEADPGETFLDARPAQQTRLGDRSLTRALGLKLRRVVIDAGHGGHDTGTISRNGLKEKDLVLDVALRLGALIEERLGSEVVYTRDTDLFVPLEDRTSFANRQKADLFLSIHANSSPSRNAAGMETFYLNFTTSKDDLDLAARENASSEKSIHDLSDLVRRITLQDKVEESREFASRVQTAGYELTAKTHGRLKNRGVKKAPFVVLIGARMPSVLVEIGFLTNSKEESMLKKTGHRDKIAEALFKGVSRYADGLSHFRVAQSSASHAASESQ